MSEEEYNSVVENMRLPVGLPGLRACIFFRPIAQTQGA
jgi:hypothetical protein